MSNERKSSGFALRLLLLINAVLIGAMFFMLRDIKHQPKSSDCSESNAINLSTDALNSIAIKLM